MEMFERLFKLVGDSPSKGPDVGGSTANPSSTKAPSTPLVLLKPQQKKRKFEHISNESPIISKDALYLVNVDITVGDTVFPTSLEKLRSRSYFFRRELRKNPMIHEFSFPDEEPAIFHRMQHWVYNSSILLPSEDKSEDPNDLRSSQSAENENSPHSSKKDAAIPFSVHGAGDGSSTPTFRRERREDTLDSQNYLADDEDATQTLKAAPDTTHSASLDTMTLTKMYVFAERLEMPTLCNTVMDLLGERLGNDGVTPTDALIYAFQRCKAKSLLRKMLIEFTAHSAPIHDLVERFAPNELPPQLMFDLLSQIPFVRGNAIVDEEPWIKRFNAEKDVFYHLKVR